MLDVEDWAEIRRLHFAEKLPIKVIARRLGISKNTVKAKLSASEPPEYERAPIGSIVDEVREPALGLFRTLDAARNETAHVAVADRAVKRTRGHQLHPPLPVDRPEENQPPTMGADGSALDFPADIALRTPTACLGSRATHEPSG